VRRLGAALLLVASLIFLVQQIAAQSDGLRHADWRPGWGAAAAIGLIGCGQALAGGLTYAALRLLGARPPWNAVIGWYLLSQATKYLPAGGAINLAAQGAAIGRLPGVGVRRSAVALAVMLTAVCCGALTAAGVGVLVGGGQRVFGVPAAAALPALLVLLAAPPTRRALQRLAGVPGPGNGASSAVVTLGAGAALMWLALGAGLAVLAADFTDVSAGVAAQLGGALAAAWLAGFFAFVVPAGLGVREVVLVVLLRNVLPEPWPVVVAVASRFCWTAADALGLAVGGVLLRAALRGVVAPAPRDL
jgi:hypothetical protein